MSKVRIVVILGWVGFIYTFGLGILFFALPEGIARFAMASGSWADTLNSFSIPFQASGLSYFVPRLFAIMLLTLGLAYLLAALDPAASRSLLIVATCQKVLAVLYCLAAYFSGTVKDGILGGVIMDGILALVGIYAVVTMGKQKAG